MRYYVCKLYHIQGLGTHFPRVLIMRLFCALSDRDLIDFSIHSGVTTMHIFDLAIVIVIDCRILIVFCLTSMPALRIINLYFAILFNVAKYFVV